MHFDYQLLIKNLLLNPIVKDLNQEIIYKDEKRFTYEQFHKRICQLANALSDMGIKAGDTVAVMDYDSHRYLECYFAIPMIGAVLHTVNVRLTPEQILYTIDNAEDDILLINKDFLPIIEQIKGRIDMIKEYIIINDDDEKPNTTLPINYEYEKWISGYSDKYDFPDFDEKTRATIFYTTGTTGMPKGVFFNHRQLVLHTLGAISSFSSGVGQNIRQDDVYMPMTPMFHVHAWGFPYIATFLGLKQIYPGKYIPDVLLDLLENEKVTFSHCVPTIMHMLMSSPRFENMNFSGWKVVIGGSALPKSMCLEAMQKGIDIFTGYGMSETCPILTISQLTPQMIEANNNTQADLRIKTGRPLGLVEIKLVDDKMNGIPNDGISTGEIVVRSPWLTEQYFKDHKTSQSLWEGGYLHTGDVAHIDKNHYIKITDRAKDVIKVGGEWVSSLELEDIIAQHPSVKEVAVVSTDDDKWVERPLALVIPKINQNTLNLEKTLLTHTREYIKKGVMARESMLLKIQLVEHIDKTSVGKIDKKTLRLKYANK